jgi:hypothetical protein
VKLTRANVRSYLDRPWAALEEAKRAHWQARKHRGGLAEVLRVADELRTRAMLVDPTWPSERDREQDLETHRRVAAALARTAVAARRVRRRR